MANQHSTLGLPPEICEAIFKHIPPGTRDLAALCLVSVSFHHDAERILYREVRLRDHQLAVFCATTTKRPHLLLAVQTLNIALSISLTGTEINMLSRLLHGLVNLRALEFNNRGEYIPAESLLYGCTFALRSFQATWGLEADTIEFLKAQVNITHWGSISSNGLRGVEQRDLPDDALPSLVSVNTSENILARIGTHRPLTHLQLKLENHRRIYPLLLPYSHTLRSLSVHITTGLGANWSHLPGLTLALDGLLPNIVSLKMSECSIVSKNDLIKVCTIARHSFGKLQTLVIGDTHVNGSFSQIAITGYMIALRKVMEKWPTIRMLVFHGKSHSKTLKRSSSGNIDEELGIYKNFEA